MYVYAIQDVAPAVCAPPFTHPTAVIRALRVHAPLLLSSACTLYLVFIRDRCEGEKSVLLLYHLCPICVHRDVSASLLPCVGTIFAVGLCVVAVCCRVGLLVTSSRALFVGALEEAITENPMPAILVCWSR